MVCSLSVCLSWIPQFQEEPAAISWDSTVKMPEWVSLEVDLLGPVKNWMNELGIRSFLSQALRRLQSHEKPWPTPNQVTCRFLAHRNSVQFSSFTQSCLTLCNPMDCSMSGFPVHHQLPELTQIHAHWVGDAIQLSYPLSSPSPPAFSLSQHQGLFQWISSSHQVAKLQSIGVSASASILPMNYSGLPLGLTGLVSLQSKGLSRVFSNITLQKHQLFDAQLSLQSNSHIYIWLLEKP